MGATGLAKRRLDKTRQLAVYTRGRLCLEVVIFTRPPTILNALLAGAICITYGVFTSSQGGSPYVSSSKGLSSFRLNKSYMRHWNLEDITFSVGCEANR